MSNVVKSITVVMEEDVHEEYADELMRAIVMFKGVLTAEANVVDGGDYVYEMRQKAAIQDKLYKIIKEI